MADALNFPWLAVNNRVAKSGVGAYLTAPADTAVTTSYTRLLGTFSNVEISDFEIDGTSGKLTYRPADGVSRTFLLLYSAQVEAPSVNDVITIGVEAGNGAPAIIAGSERSVVCRTAGSPYAIANVIPVTLDDEDTIEIQIKGDSSFTATVDEFSTALIKMF